MPRLRIAGDLSFPIDAVTQTLAAIGRKGAVCDQPRAHPVLEAPKEGR